MTAALLMHIQRFSIHLLLPQSLDTLFKTCLVEACRLVTAEYGSLFLLKNERLIRVLNNVPTQRRLHPRRHGTLFEPFLDGKIHILPPEKVRQLHPQLGEPLPTLLLLPLSYHQQHIGLLSLHVVRSLRLTKELRQALLIFASLAALAIRNLEFLERSTHEIHERELFMSAAAHELANPLTVIVGYAELMQKKLDRGAPVKPEWVAHILDGSGRLLNLIQELLTISQIRTGLFSYNFTHIDLLPELHNIIREFQVLHTQPLRLINNLPSNSLPLIADREKLRLVIFNLLNNAAKHSATDAEIQLTLEKSDGYFRITIQDFGRGIPKKELKKVFEKYYRGTASRSGGPNGLGLGMYLCREIMIAHNGDISLQSQVHKGTRALLLLPEIGYEEPGPDTSFSSLPE